MKVELFHVPGCKTYQKIKNMLESIIAEERLPIAVETQETKSSKKKPMVSIDGCKVESNQQLSFREKLSSLIMKRWYEVYEAPLKQVI